MSDSGRGTALRWGNFAALVAVIGVNMAAVFLPLNGVQTSEWSDQWPTRVTPADYAFRIWSVLYFWLIGFGVAQVALKGLESWVRRIGWWFIVSCAFNAAWLFAWHHERLALSMAMMLGMLATLAGIQVRLRTPGPVQDSAAARWLVRYPLGAYLGWIIVATVANLAITLRWLGWDGLFPNPPTWAVGLLLVAATIGTAIGARMRNPLVPLAVAWGVAAIAVGQAQFPWVQRTGWVCAIVLVSAAAVPLLRSGSTPVAS